MARSESSPFGIQVVEGPRRLFYIAEFESGQVNAQDDPVDGMSVRTAYDTQPPFSFEGINDGGAGPSEPFDCKVVESEQEPPTGNGSSSVIVTPRQGQYMFRSAIYKTKDYELWDGTDQAGDDTDRPRCHHYPRPVPDTLGNPKTVFDTETWVGVSIYLPTNLESNSQRNMLCSVNSDGASTTHISFGLDYPEVGRGHWGLRLWISDTLVVENGATVHNVDGGSYAPDLGKWTDWVFRVRFNPFTESTNASSVNPLGRDQVYPGNAGIIQVWKTTGDADASGHRQFVEITDGVLPIIDAPTGLVPNRDFDLEWSWRQYRPTWRREPNDMDGPSFIWWDCFYMGEAARDGTTFADVNPGRRPPP
ncbi:MAG: hypothetical protein JRI23_36620 [Deltaproteobacteria bacterium]|jgi:hypothetical protein|nr:hypothetical protein [Deltaproteobacteria bacterium]MBW2537888.1 hypothetical protein [Deltaproteobacteria bacterium]